MKIFCIDINNSNLNKIKRLNYIPVGLGENNFNEEWLQDNSGDHISEKNYQHRHLHHENYDHHLSNLPLLTASTLRSTPAPTQEL